MDGGRAAASDVQRRPAGPEPSGPQATGGPTMPGGLRTAGGPRGTDAPTAPDAEPPSSGSIGAVRTYKARRRTSPGQVEVLARLAPAYAVPLDRPLDAAAVFGRSAPLVLEIGSGTGDATAAMAAADPGRDLLAVEVHTPGVAALLRRIEELGLVNLRVVEADALQVLASVVPAGSLDEVRVFFPDPWPKARHAKRRLVSPAFAGLVADRLRPGGRLHVATDWPSYADHVLAVLTASPDLELVGRERGDRPLTRFEARGAAAGRPSCDLVAVRR